LKITHYHFYIHWMLFAKCKFIFSPYFTILESRRYIYIEIL
jgi:hypothetical protein